MTRGINGYGRAPLRTGGRNRGVGAGPSARPTPCAAVPYGGGRLLPLRPAPTQCRLSAKGSPRVPTPRGARGTLGVLGVLGRKRGQIAVLPKGATPGLGILGRRQGPGCPVRPVSWVTMPATTSVAVVIRCVQTIGYGDGYVPERPAPLCGKPIGGRVPHNGEWDPSQDRQRLRSRK